MPRNSNHQWTAEQEAQLREWAEAGISATLAAARSKRSRSAVISKAQRLGLRFQPPQRLAGGNKVTRPAAPSFNRVV
ncbi:MAG: GcrA family cell cycle regulator [Xanthobacteraceae bacterium]|nr:GcrA family cell cycle regulator [Xanthobacteraceae bacterium]